MKFFIDTANIDQIKEYLEREKIKLAILINFTHEKVVYKRIVNFSLTKNNQILK